MAQEDLLDFGTKRDPITNNFVNKKTYNKIFQVEEEVARDS